MSGHVGVVVVEKVVEGQEVVEYGLKVVVGGYVGVMSKLGFEMEQSAAVAAQ